MILSILLVLIFCKSNHGIIGFNCGSNDPAVSTYSLVDTGECDFHEDDVKITNATIELLQLAEFKTIRVIQCKIEIKRTVYHCGMFSHLGPTEHAVQEYLYEVSAEKCKFIFETGIFKYDNTHTIAGLEINNTKTTGVDLAGKVEGKTCSGAAYADNYGSWDNVFVQGLIKITISEEYAKVHLNNNKLHLNSGTVCKFSDEHCIDSQAGYTFWSHLPENCFENKYDVLYKGIVTKTLSPTQEIIFTINTYDISFSLTATETVQYCDRTITKTEHPKLFIYEKTAENALFDNDIRQNIDEFSINIFSYVNAKFIHVEKHFRIQLKNLYLNILTQMCELERKEIQNSLSLASISPDEFAYNIMQKPGYLAKLAGEAIHIIKCTPTNVKIRHTEECYEELPVQSGNTTWFLTPKTHILVKMGTKTSCTSIIPPYYKVDNDWINLLPTPRKIEKNITKFSPKVKKSWEQKKLNSLGTSGIYSQKDLEDFEERSLFPLEKRAIINKISRAVTGVATEKDEFLSSLLTENSLSHIAESTWNKIIDKYTRFGSISAGIFMTFVLFQLCKIIVDIIIQGFTLHSLYGWSRHLFGAIFSSITHLLIALNVNGNRISRRKNRRNSENIQLQEVIVEKPPTSGRKLLLNKSEIEDIELQEITTKPPFISNPIPARTKQNQKTGFEELRVHRPVPPLPSLPPSTEQPKHHKTQPQTPISIFSI